METRENSESFSSGRALFLTRFGAPLEVVEEGAAPVEEPGAGEALIKVELAPINPADLNVLEGRYGTLPALPCVPGIEGVGRVLRVGSGLGAAGEALAGRRVLLPQGFGSWRSHGTALASELVAVPEAVPVEQAAMLRINPATALVLLEHFVVLKPGDWIVQNAANSGVGRSVIQIARACGWRTINVVRRGGLGEELSAIGGDAVLETGEDLGAKIAEITGGAPPRLGLNAVGGESALALAKTLAESGVLVTYGAMGLQPVRIPNGLLIFKDLAVRGLWISRWYKNAPQSQRERLFEKLFHWAGNGVLHTPVEAVYSLQNHREALAHAMRAERSGKVLFKG